MTKHFFQCSLADLAHELQLAARDASCSALNAEVVALIIPCLLDTALTETVLRMHPRVGCRSGLVCTAASESKQAWCSMLRDLFLSAGVSVSDAAQLGVYLVVKECAERGHARLHGSSPAAVSIVPTLTSGRWSLQLFSVLEQLHGARVFLRLCNGKGVAAARIQLAPPAQRLSLRSLVPVYEMGMEQRQRLSAMGCGGKGKVALLMSQGEEGAVERHCSVLMDCIVRRVAAGQFTATPEGLYKNAEALCVGGECAAAAQQLQRAIGHGHLPSRALKAWILLRGREGVAQDCNGAFELVEEGARLGCHHCQGVMAWCYWGGNGCVRDEARSVELARESSGKGSRYGQFTLGLLYRHGGGGVAQDYAQAVALYRLAAAQNLDDAQYSLGYMYYDGIGVAQDDAEALRLYQLAAAQGHPVALFNIALLDLFLE